MSSARVKWGVEKKSPKVGENDPWLAPYSDLIRDRSARFKACLAEFESLVEFATSHPSLVLHREDWFSLIFLVTARASEDLLRLSGNLIFLRDDK